jgi:hypothetical protein
LSNIQTPKQYSPRGRTCAAWGRSPAEPGTGKSELSGLERDLGGDALKVKP